MWYVLVISIVLIIAPHPFTRNAQSVVPTSLCMQYRRKLSHSSACLERLRATCHSSHELAGIWAASSQLGTRKVESWVFPLESFQHESFSFFVFLDGIELLLSHEQAFPRLSPFSFGQDERDHSVFQRPPGFAGPYGFPPTMIEVRRVPTHRESYPVHPQVHFEFFGSASLWCTHVHVHVVHGLFPGIHLFPCRSQDWSVSSCPAGPSVCFLRSIHTHLPRARRVCSFLRVRLGPPSSQHVACCCFANRGWFSHVADASCCTPCIHLTFRKLQDGEGTLPT